MSKLPVLIAGAGPTGLVLALCLAKQGTAFRIVDAKGGPGEASRAIAVHARTLEFYAQLGFADAVVEAGIKAQGLRMRAAGRTVGRADIAGMGQGLSRFPFVLSYAQDDHERFLVARLQEAGVAVEWNTALADVTEVAGGADVVLERGGARETVRVAYVAGCDGARSRVREIMGVGFPGGTYDQLFYVADARVDAPIDTDLVLNMGARTFALMLPVRSTGMHRLIGTMHRPAAGAPAPQFSDVQAEVEALLGVHVEALNWFSTYHVHHRVAAAFRVGRCFLAGDAAHIHSPAGGQGMNTGIGDAVNLAWKLAAVTAGRALPTLLDSYEAERIGFARSLVATTDRAFEAIVDPGWRGRFVRTWLMPKIFPAMMRLAPARRAVFRMISQIRIAYPGSPLSRGNGGSVRGGDRLPWVAEPDNFAPLQAMAWQLHVYGVLQPDMVAATAALHLPAHTFAWSDGVRHAGLRQNAAYLVRPDGYVALVQPQQDGAALLAYAADLGLQFGTG